MDDIKRLLAEAATASTDGLHDKAIELAQKVLLDDKTNIPALFILGVAYYSIGSFQQARGAFEQYTVLAPKNDQGWYNLGLTCTGAGDHKAAFDAHRRALKLNPNNSKALINVAQYLEKGGAIEEAITCFNKAIALNPTEAGTYNNAANVMKNVGMTANALQYYQKALELMPSMMPAASNICYLQQFIPGVSVERLKPIHDDWNERFCKIYEGNRKPHENTKDPERQLKVGFISEDFRKHTVGRYLIGVFEYLDTEEFSTFCYSLRAPETDDEITQRFKDSATRFDYVHTLSDTELVERIREDGIDILFDLSGHTSGNRLGVFARKPAPVQMTWLGYVGTTGLDAIDYKIASEASAPMGVDPYYSERILRFPKEMPHQCYTPLDEEVEIAPCPSSKNGYVTFGTVSNVAKLNRQTLGMWANILTLARGEMGSPNSAKLLLKGSTYMSDAIRKGVLGVLSQFDVQEEDVFFDGFEPHPDALGAYNRIDVALDPMPFSGCTTTCEALWMGVPVVTLPGNTEASRHSISYLKSVGLHDMVAMTPKDYQDKAVELAMNVQRRTQLRETLRGKLLASPVCDKIKFAEELGKLMRGAWYDFCNG